MVKLFSTSQPESHRKLHPLTVVVCTRLKLIRAAGWTDSRSYLTNTTFTQLYCTGLGDHSEMSYRTLRPVRRFLRWLRSQEDAAVLSRALIGGCFVYPPPPVSLETFMKGIRGEPGFLRGAELQREMARLCYRERRTFCIQAAVTMVTYSRIGEEDRCLFWTDRASSSPSSSSFTRPSPSSSSFTRPSPSSSSPSPLPPLCTPRSFRPPLSSSSSSLSPSSSAVSHLSPGRSGASRKRRQLLPAETPKKRHPWVTVQPEPNKTVVLFEASMEFLENVDDEDDEDEEDATSFVTAPLLPTFPPVAMETLPMRYDHGRREEQAVAVAMGGRPAATATRFDSALKDYYTLRLRALSDGVLVDAIFLPHSSSSSPLLPPSLTPTPGPPSSHTEPSPHTHPPSPASFHSGGKMSKRRQSLLNLFKYSGQADPKPANTASVETTVFNCSLLQRHLDGSHISPLPFPALSPSPSHDLKASPDWMKRVYPLSVQAEEEEAERPLSEQSETSSSRVPSSLLSPGLLCLLLAAALALLACLIWAVPEPPCQRSGRMPRSFHLTLTYVNGPPPT
ncbi:nuclear envelope pore membrane protein POM 121-like [Perca fluviatilis]|uniref:nuclear envelope pore membrane protein POM 121-like n=1 Tax=Perca fluviatilis TaxID=8168 RepID=UPI001964D429|nr:nuclear envelope pore membrane protein POM 121-like [Perca fluviatilis]